MAERMRMGRQVRRRLLQLPPVGELVDALARGDARRVAAIRARARAALPSAGMRESGRALRTLEAAFARGERVESSADVDRLLTN